MQITSEAQAHIAVETIVPNKQLPVNSCGTPCMFSISFAPGALSSPSAADMGSDVHQGNDAQRHLAEALVRQHMSSLIGSSNGLPHLQTSSCVKVNDLLTASMYEHVKCNMHGGNSSITHVPFDSLHSLSDICLHAYKAQ